MVLGGCRELGKIQPLWQSGMPSASQEYQLTSETYIQNNWKSWQESSEMVVCIEGHWRYPSESGRSVGKNSDSNVLEARVCCLQCHQGIWGRYLCSDSEVMLFCTHSSLYSRCICGNSTCTMATPDDGTTPPLQAVPLQEEREEASQWMFTPLWRAKAVDEFIYPVL